MSYFLLSENFYAENDTLCFVIVAVQPGDYAMNSDTFTFTSSSAVDSQECLPIVIEEDTLNEGDEMFTVSLELLVTPTLPVLFGQTAVTIEDNEGQLHSLVLSLVKDIIAIEGFLIEKELKPYQVLPLASRVEPQ